MPVACCNRRGFPAEEISFHDDGGLAQLGERLPCKQEVSGSIPLISTKPTGDGKRRIREREKRRSVRGIERRLLTTCRWHVVTGVAFPQKSDPANLHQAYKKEID